MTRWFAQNVGTMILALILAIMVWFVALQSQDPIISREYPRPVPIKLEHQPAGTVLVNEAAGEVRVTLRGPRSALDNVTDNQVNASADLQQLGDGQNRVCVTVQVSAPDVIVDPSTKPQPDCISVDLERVEQRDIGVQIKVDGKPARGYQAEPPVPAAVTATVSGPEPYVQRISRVLAPLSITEARTTITQVVGLQPLDAAGQVVNGITMTPTQITVTVPISKLEDFKELPVTVNWQGQPAAGYSVTGINVDPLTVLVTGSTEAVRNLPGFVRTTPVDIAGSSQSVLRRVALVLPAGVTLVGEQNVLVEVVIQPIQVSSTITRTVELQGLGPAYTATVSPPTVDVILTGPVAALNALAPDDVRVFVDVLQVGPGTYTLTPRPVILPDGVKAQTVLPSTLQVIISVAPTPTPEGTGTPTPTPTGKPRPG